MGFAAALIAAALLLGLAMPSVSAAKLRAPPVHLLPGLERVRPTDSEGIRALTRYLPRKLARGVRSAPRDAAAAVGSGQRVQLTLLELRKVKRARRIVARWRAGARRARAKPRRARVGAGGWLASRKGKATVIWRSLSRVGVVHLRARPRPTRSQALAFARFADVELSVPPPATAWDRVLDRTRPNGTLSKQTALQAFSLAYGPLPGVRAPAGRAGDVDGTFAATWTLRYRSSLTAKQRRVVDRRLGLLRSERAAARRAQGDVALGVKRDQDLESEINGFLVWYYQRLPIPGPTFPVVAGYTTDPPKEGNAVAETLPFDESGNPGVQSTCRVRVNEQEAQNLKPEKFHHTVAHEAFHCLQNAALGARVLKGKADAANTGWVSEGMADWAGAMASPISYQDFVNLQNYVQAVWVNPMFEWTVPYIAAGFFGHLDDALPNYWPRVLPTLEQQTNEAAFVAAGGTTPSAFESWGSSRFRIPNAGDAWMMDSPLQAPHQMPTYHVIKPGGELGIAESGFVGAEEYTTKQARISAPADQPIVRVGVEGYGRLVPLLGPDVSVQDRAIRDGEVLLCAQGKCECPEGHTGDPPETEPWSFPSALALTGPAGAHVEFQRLEQYCQPPPPGSDDPLTCNSCGSSNGDPHLVTFDGRPYDFQAVGEFTLIRSRSGDLEIQARQQPARTLARIPSDTVSVNTALAMRVAGSRVGVYAAKRGMRVRVNGRRVDTPADGQSLDLRGGGELAGRAGQLAVVWPDGSEARVWSVGSYGVAIMMLPAPARAGNLVGLLGNFDEDQSNDFATRKGKRLRPGSLLGSGKRAFRRLYRTFGDSWRIRQRQSLFDYRRGRTTRSYTRLRFPSRPFTVRSLPRALRRRAARICRQAGVTDPQVLENCILDVAATGDRAFAQDAVTLEATAKRSGAWTRLSGALSPAGVSTTPSLAAAGERVVAAYRRGETAIEAATFTPDPRGARDVARTSAVEGWHEVRRPFLLRAPGGGLQLFFDGVRSVNPDDPLNGAVLVPRRADGSFGPPTLAAQRDWPVVNAATDDAGVPIWVTPTIFGTIYIWRGAESATSHDLGDFARGVPFELARDANGRLWLAWESYTGPDSTAELFMGELDPETGEPAPGPAPQRAPVGGEETFGGLFSEPRLACAATCRLVFSHRGRLVSWAPGEAATTEVASGGAELGVLAAAAAPDGRLWTAWTEFDAGQWVVKAKLGDSAGAGGSPAVLRAPTADTFPGRAGGLSLPGRFVLAVDWSDADGSVAWAAVVPED